MVRVATQTEQPSNRLRMSVRDTGAMSTPQQNRSIDVLGPLVVVDDPDDIRLEQYRNLNDPPGRRQYEANESIFVVEGKIAVARLLKSDFRVRSLLVDDHQVDSAAELVESVRAQGAPVYVGARAVVEATVGFAIHRGVVAIADRPQPSDALELLAQVAGRPHSGGGPPIVAVLEGLNDNENIGALFRNAAAFGVGAVLLDPTCADPLYRRSVRVSMGYVLHVPFARLSPWPDALDQIREAGFVVAALSPDPQMDDHSDADRGVPDSSLAQLRSRLAEVGHGAGNGSAGSVIDSTGVALVFGAEGPGLSGAALSAADMVVSIPMAPGVDSLNVATTAAVAFHSLTGG